MNHVGPVYLGRNLSRRALLRSALTAAGISGLSVFPSWQAQAASSSRSQKRSLILLWQDGGASHFETFDPKPDAPAEYRGELGAIQTTLPGVAFCEVLPRLAQLAHRFSVVRSLHQPSSGHVDGSHNVLTGWYGETEGGKPRYPDLASVISRMRSGADDAEISIGASTDPRLAKGMRGPGARLGADSGRNALPRYIDLSKGIHRGGPAFLGPLHGPFQVAGDPSKPGFVVQNLQSLGSATRFHDRQQMLSGLDRLGKRDIVAFEQLRAVDGFQRQAVELLSGGGAARAFDLSREQPVVRQRYGLHLGGQQCLLARRLVESGVEVVAVRFAPDGRGDYEKTMIGWDDHAVHGNIFEIMRRRGPQFDQAVSALIEDLEARGMQDEVLVVVVGEFGRTPRVHVHKGCPGREHWGPAGCALVYGGGLTMGQVVGSTNEKGERPQDRPLSYQDLLATIYHSMGINPGHTFVNLVGRPVPILSTGEPIAELSGSNSSSSRKRSDKTRINLASAEMSQTRSLTLPAGATNTDLAGQSDLSCLETLVAHDTAIDDEGLIHLEHCDSLTRLQLNGTPITDAGLAHLSRLTVLEELNLTGTQVTDAGLVHLRTLTRLKRFFFNGTAVTLSGVVRLFVQEQGRTLGNALGAMGLARFDDQGHTIAINVAATSFGDDEMQYLEQLPRLRELHLAATGVTDAGMVHVKRLAQLEELYLAKCAVTDAGLAHVARLSRLRAINIYGTQITTAGLEHLMGLEALRMLMITDLKLKTAVVDKLKAKLPRLTVTDFTPA
jgi:hypothetical protein